MGVNRELEREVQREKKRGRTEIDGEKEKEVDKEREHERHKNSRKPKENVFTYILNLQLWIRFQLGTQGRVKRFCDINNTTNIIIRT